MQCSLMHLGVKSSTRFAANRKAEKTIPIYSGLTNLPQIHIYPEPLTVVYWEIALCGYNWLKYWIRMDP